MAKKYDIDFDPYYRWLGIPKGNRPVNHYQLLGVSSKEQDRELIADAAERQKMVVKTFGANSEKHVASRLLYEIEEACFILLDQDYRRQYNRFLKEKKEKKGWTRAYKKWRKKTLKESELPQEYITTSIESDFIGEFLVLFSIIFVGFALMAAISFYLPWNTLFKQENGQKKNGNRIAQQVPKLPQNKGAVKKQAPEQNVNKHDNNILKKRAAKKSDLSNDKNSVALFNGMNLGGWQVHIPKELKAKASDCWVVDEKRQVLKCLGNGDNWIETIPKYKNFNLKLEWRFPKGTQITPPGSGVVVRSVKAHTNGKWPTGVEANLTNGTSGDFFRQSIRMETDNPNPKNRRHFIRLATAERPVGEWNSMEMICNKKNIRVILNDQIVNEARGVPQLNGRICLLSQGCSVEFRNIRIAKNDSSNSRGNKVVNQPVKNQALKANAKKTVGQADGLNALTPLFDGKTLKGWKTYGSDNTYGWTVQNGELRTTTRKKIPNLVTAASYRDFEFQCEFWLDKKANSGIYLRGRYEVQLLDDPNYPKVKKTGRCGSIFGLIPPGKSVYRGPRKWNDLVVRLEGKIVTVVLNAETVIDRKRINKVTGGQFIDKLENGVGPIALQHYGDLVRFRNIKIQRLLP